MLPYWKDRWPVSGNLSLALSDHDAPTVHRPTVPPSGERAVIIITIAVALFDHLRKRARCLIGVKNRQRGVDQSRTGRDGTRRRFGFVVRYS